MIYKYVVMYKNDSNKLFVCLSACLSVTKKQDVSSLENSVVKNKLTTGATFMVHVERNGYVFQLPC